MAVTCPECGAPLPDGGTCRRNLDSLLLLEWEIPGGPGGMAHFLAVSSYVLQHPDAMGSTAEALAGLRRCVADQLAGRVTMEQLRRRVRRAADGTRRITRRAGDDVPRWPVGAWPMTVADVLAGGAEGYGERVAAWADSIVRTLDAADI
jgi:Family of unknown function (DUF5946)